MLSYLVRCVDDAILVLPLELFDSDVAEGHRAVGVFEADAAGAGGAACCDLLRSVLDDLLSVQLDLHPVAVAGDDHVIPLAGRLRHVLRGGGHVDDGARRVVAELPVCRGSRGSAPGGSCASTSCA